MLDAILPLRRYAVASRLSRPAHSFFSTPSFQKSPLGESQYGGTATNACRAASSATRRSTDLSGGSTGVLICIPHRGTRPGGTQQAKIRAPRIGRKTTPAVALTFRISDCQSHSSAFQAGSEPAGRSQVPRARIRAPISYYLREVPYARRSNEAPFNSNVNDLSNRAQKWLTKLD